MGPSTSNNGDRQENVVILMWVSGHAGVKREKATDFLAEL